MCEIAKYVKTAEESKQLNNRKGPMIIISASGMATGGRILHHLRAFGPDAKNTILLSGFQAAGTRGEALAHGARRLRIHGQDVAIGAEIAELDNFSAHADQNEILAWLRTFERPPKNTFVIHGEPEASKALAERIENELSWNVRVPEYRERVLLQ